MKNPSERTKDVCRQSRLQIFLKAKPMRRFMLMPPHSCPEPRENKKGGAKMKTFLTLCSSGTTVVGQTKVPFFKYTS